MAKIRLICATRLSQDEFFKSAALGRSFKVYEPVMPELEIYLFPDNTQGLPSLYNEAIEHAANNPAVLVFVHDDVHLSDFYWGNHVTRALNYFDVVGLAGNKRRLPKQASWHFLNTDLLRDEPEYLSGIVGHGNGFPVDVISAYGEAGQECKLLDGLFLAVNSETLIKHQLRFDPQFDFHFYDMDFCRQVELKGLKMGTCYASLIHESPGGFGQAWQNAYQKYLLKYDE
jgi:GT2 family glycosyltransferase